MADAAAHPQVESPTGCGIICPNPRPKPNRMSTSTARTQLLQVARCGIVAECLNQREPDSPCARVVLHQWKGIDDHDRLERWPQLHQIPEPWVGHLEQAQIVFVSSNPSISGRIDPASDRSPGLTWEHPDDDIVDRYDKAFERWITQGTRVGGKRPTAYWREIKSRAQELLPTRPVRPGVDYALTEAVRCKSRSEDGVPEARTTCSRRYLGSTLEVSRAPLVVFLGRHAERAAHDVFQIPTSFGWRPAQQHVTEAHVGGRLRTVAFLPSANFRGKRTAAASWTLEELDSAREAAATAS